MPFVSGFLRVRRRRPGRPDQGLPPGEDIVDPGWGIDEGEPPQVEPPDPDEAPPGLWPPPTVGHPIEPLPPGSQVPPGSIWPRPPGAPPGKFVVLAWVPGYGYRYVVVDLNAVWPQPPDRPLPEPQRR